MKPVKIFMR